MVTGQDIVASAYKLLGASYRQWYSGSLLPMWLADGQGSVPPAEYLVYGPGVMCADLISWACWDNGIDAPGGTGGWGNDFLVNTSDFDPGSPGEAGAICLATFGGYNGEGHIALFTGGGDGHQLIQSLTTTGVTDQFTDTQTYVWPECGFEIYGHIPGVTYQDIAPEPAQPEPTNWFGIGSDNVVRLGGDYSNGWLGTDRDGWIRRVK